MKKPTIDEVWPLVQAYRERYGTNLHIVLDDLNIDDGSVEFCLERCIADTELAIKLSQMSKTQRKKLGCMR